MQLYSTDWWIVNAAFPFLLCYFISSLPALFMLARSAWR